MMFRPPDVEGQCNAWYLMPGVDYDDATVFVCEKEPGHFGFHSCSWHKSNGSWVALNWSLDERPAFEREEEYDRGIDDGCREDAVCEEPGEAYLEGFCRGRLDFEEYWGKEA